MAYENLSTLEQQQQQQQHQQQKQQQQQQHTDAHLRKKEVKRREQLSVAKKTAETEN